MFCNRYNVVDNLLDFLLNNFMQNFLNTFTMLAFVKTTK